MKMHCLICFTALSCGANAEFADVGFYEASQSCLKADCPPNENVAETLRIGFDLLGNWENLTVTQIEWKDSGPPGLLFSPTFIELNDRTPGNVVNSALCHEMGHSYLENTTGNPDNEHFSKVFDMNRPDDEFSFESRCRQMTIERNL